MHVTLHTQIDEKIIYPILIVPVFSDRRKWPDALGFLNDSIAPSPVHWLKQEQLEWKVGRHLAVFTRHSRFPLVIMAGAGPVSSWNLETARELWGNFSRMASEFRGNSPAIYWDDQMPVPLNHRLFFTEAIAALHTSHYRVTHFLTDRSGLAPEIDQVDIIYPGAGDDIRHGIELGENLGKSVNLSRQLAEFPSNFLNPATFVERIHELARTHPWKVETLDRERMEELGLGALLAVARGSENPPYLVLIEYRHTEANLTVGLVGKGVTFDSGGISIKPARDMDEMKYDMSGAAAVVGCLSAATLTGLPVNIIAVLPLVENMPSGKAIKPGDIITAYSGKTVEIADTDAEGRLILADALSYLEKNYSPDFIIDLATLTGSVVSALGHLTAGAFSPDSNLLESMQRAADVSGEKIWPLPVWDEYRELLKSKIADIRNIPSKPGAGAVTAAVFLKYFVEKAAWLHLDIAGTAYGMPEKSYRPEGATGFGVRLLWHWLRRLVYPEENTRAKS